MISRLSLNGEQASSLLFPSSNLRNDFEKTTHANISLFPVHRSRMVVGDFEYLLASLMKRTITRVAKLTPSATQNNRRMD